jgi:hypothetical protein
LLRVTAEGDEFGWTRTVGKVGNVDSAGDAFCVGVGEGARVLQGPAEGVGEDDDCAEGLDTGIGMRNICRDAVDGGFLARWDHVAAEGAREAIATHGGLHCQRRGRWRLR